MEDAAGARVSDGFIHSRLAAAAGSVATATKLIKTLITASAAAGFDEAALQDGPVGAQKPLLGAFTECYSALFLDERTLASFREFGILPELTGIGVCDRYRNYLHVGWEHLAGHQGCCSHVRRDFEYAAQCWPGQIWAEQVQRAPRGVIRAWRQVLDAGLAETPGHPRPARPRVPVRRPGRAVDGVPQPRAEALHLPVLLAPARPSCSTSLTTGPGKITVTQAARGGWLPTLSTSKWRATSPRGTESRPSRRPWICSPSSVACSRQGISNTFTLSHSLHKK